jgi:hypothetical protein
MTELARPSPTAETADQAPAGEIRAGSHDSQARYPSAVSAADTDPSYYDGDIKAALAADTTPTRQQAARDAAAQDQVGDGTATSHDDAPASSRAPDIEAILHENDNLPEPRTRQQAARDAAASITPTDKDRAAAGDQQTRSGPGPLTGTASETTVTTAKPADLPLTIVHASPEMRTLGDDTPTGIGLKPTGDQIVEVEDQKASRAERARREFLSEENLGDAFDATDEWAKTGQDLFRRPPTGRHVEVPAQGPAMTAMPQQQIDPGSVATAGLALGILGAEFVRWGRHKVGHMKGRHHASDR